MRTKIAPAAERRMIMAEYIKCRNCESPDCKGCNLKRLETMLENGKFDCMMNENRCINTSADVEPVQEWISVKDRLPENGGYVVCIAKRNPFSRFMPMVARIKKNGWVNPITEQYISHVTHWMPLPEPPKEEET